MTETISGAIAKRDNGPQAMIDQYRGDFAKVLPTHLAGQADMWVRLLQGYVRRNDKVRQAAVADPGAFFAAAMECARLGLEPGDTFHFVPIGGKVVGITDYTGEIELIYRAGAVASVKAEVVYSEDSFHYRPDMERPIHEVDWFGVRGEMVGAYAYAVMKDGATSRVVVMNKKEIDKHKAVNKLNASGRSDNPWVAWTDAMWLKTVVKQLEKWVPSSPEYRAQTLRAQAEAEQVKPAARPVDVSHLQEVPDRVVDAELVDRSDEQVAMEAQQ